MSWHACTHTALIDEDTDHVSAAFSDAPCIFSPACNSTLESSGCVWPAGCRPSTNYFINMCAYKAHNPFTCTHLPVLSIQTNRPFSIYLHLVLLVPPPPPNHSVLCQSTQLFCTTILLDMHECALNLVMSVYCSSSTAMINSWNNL